MSTALAVSEGLVGQNFQLVLSDGTTLYATIVNVSGGGGAVPTPPGPGFNLTSTGNTPTSFDWELTGVPTPPGAGQVLTSTGAVQGAYAWAVPPSGFTAGGDLTGTSTSQQVVNAHMPAGTIPALGSGASGESPDNTSGVFQERQGNWVPLAADGFLTISTLPNVVPLGAVATIVVEIHITKDADPAFTAFGFFTNRMVCRNVGGTLLNTTGGQTDQPLATNNLGTGVASAQGKIDITTATPTIQVARPAGVPCHARMVVLDYYFGTSGV